MGKLNNYAGIIALATLAIVAYQVFFAKDKNGESKTSAFIGRMGLLK